MELVTGGAGFIGTNLIKKLLNKKTNLLLTNLHFDMTFVSIPR